MSTTKCHAMPCFALLSSNDGNLTVGYTPQAQLSQSLLMTRRLLLGFNNTPRVPQKLGS